MVILGIVLVLLALLLGAALLMGTSGPEVSGQGVDIRLFDAATITLDPLTLVVAGMAAMFLLWLGLVLVKTALTRTAKRRRLRKQQTAEARERREHDEHLRQEDEHLRQEQERQAAIERNRQVAREERRPGHAHDDPGPTRPISRGDHGPSDATRPIPRDGVRDDGIRDDATRPIQRGEEPRR